MSFETQIAESIACKKSLLAKVDKIREIADQLLDCLRKGNKILVAGNGGSAADSQHMAAELVGRFKAERKGLPCIALTTDTSIITAVSNDYGFERVFERQIEALGKAGDCFIAITTSGNSVNLIKAVLKAQEIGIKNILISGKGGGKLKSLVDDQIIVDSPDTARIQEAHILIIHLLCDYIEKNICANG